MATELPEIVLKNNETIVVSGPAPLEFHGDSTNSRVRITAPTITAPPPPSTGLWFEYTGPLPATYKKWDGATSLGAALLSLTSGQTLVLDFNGVRKENINITLKDNVTILPMPGKRAWLDGSLRISGGNNVKFYGLNVKWTSADPSGHMVKYDGGSVDFGHAEIAHAACYTLMRPGQAIHDSRFHHLWIHDNPGVSSHDGNQDHGFYCSAENPNQNVIIDHCLIEDMPRGRNVKIGGPSSGGAIGGIKVTKCTLRLGHGPSNGQVSNGATNNKFEYCVLIDSGKSTSLTEGGGSGGGNTYSFNASDRITGPNSSNFKDGGGNINNVATDNLLDYAKQGAAGRGHLAI
jgi:hypothetical protein